jgi:hypothetical protein
MENDRRKRYSLGMIDLLDVFKEMIVVSAECKKLSKRRRSRWNFVLPVESSDLEVVPNGAPWGNV